MLSRTAYLKGFINRQQAAARRSREGNRNLSAPEVDEIIRQLTYLNQDFDPPEDPKERLEYLRGWQDAQPKTGKKEPSGQTTSN